MSLRLEGSFSFANDVVRSLEPEYRFVRRVSNEAKETERGNRERERRVRARLDNDVNSRGHTYKSSANPVFLRPICSGGLKTNCCGSRLLEKREKRISAPSLRSSVRLVS